MRRETNFKLPEDIRNYIEQLTEIIHPKAIILFGSMARGEAHVQSDYDLMVIASDLPRDFWERQDLLWFGKPLSVDIIGLTPDEVITHINRGLILDALLEGIVVYGDAANLQLEAERYIQEQNLQRTPNGYFHRIA